MAGNIRRSLQELSAEVATNPNSTAFVELAAAYRERGDARRALWLCLRGLQRHPTHVEAHFELGRIYEARGERELALDEWNIVRQLAPDHLASRLALVRLYISEGRRADAQVELEAAQEISQGNAIITELWDELEDLEEDRPVAAREGVFDSLVADYPGTLGILLIDRDGRVIVGGISQEGVESDMALAVNLYSAQAEAERVASYLGMGDLSGFVVESDSARLTVSPVEENVVVVVTSHDVPAGRAARVGQRAWQVAQDYLSTNGR
jgi:tetratricopeptide (TPR) repeat protein